MTVSTQLWPVLRKESRVSGHVHHVAQPQGQGLGKEELLLAYHEILKEGTAIRPSRPVVVTKKPHPRGGRGRRVKRSDPGDSGRDVNRTEKGRGCGEVKRGGPMVAIIKLRLQGSKENAVGREDKCL